MIKLLTTLKQYKLERLTNYSSSYFDKWDGDIMCQNKKRKNDVLLHAKSVNKNAICME